MQKLIILVKYLLFCLLAISTIIFIFKFENNNDSSIDKSYFSDQVEKKFDCKNCNIIVVSIDTLNASHLPCYGYKKNTAPNICKIAEKGSLFANFIVHSYLTPISMMSIFTSKYPSQHGVMSFFDKISDGIITLPEVLNKNGYRTMSIGSAPEIVSSTFTDAFTKGKEDNLYLSFKKGFDSVNYTGYRNVPYEAIDSLSKINDSQKFFMWIPIGAVHFPYGKFVSKEIKNEYIDKNYNGFLKKYSYIEFWNFLSRVINNTYYPSDNSLPIELKKEDIEYINAMYDSGIKQTDNFVGDLLNEVENKGLSNNTIIIIHGIHGEQLGENGYFGHYDILEPEIRNLLVIYSPNLKPIKIDSVVRGIDIFPTILDLLNINEKLNIEGVSLKDMLFGKKAQSELSAFLDRVPLWEYAIKDEPGSGVDYIKSDEHMLKRDVGIREKNWLLINRKAASLENEISVWNRLKGNSIIRDNEYELYDINLDPNRKLEITNENMEIFLNLKNKLDDWKIKVKID